MVKTTDLTLCACGCGRTIKDTHTQGRKRKYATAACRKRGNRRERGETPPAVTMCGCGCGQTAIGPRKLYASPACRQRAYRKRRDFDELGPEFIDDERPETPRKSDRAGYKIRLNNW